MVNDRSTHQPDDSSLVAGARRGDPEAVRRLVERHQGVVYRIALSMLDDADAAEDATQETFLKALRGLSGFREDASFRTWLITIATNHVRHVVRSRRRRPEDPMPEGLDASSPEQGPAERVERMDQENRMRAALSGLPDKQRRAVALRIFDGLSFKEVAALIGSSEGAARVNYHHGIKRLRTMMEETAAWRSA